MRGLRVVFAFFAAFVFVLLGDVPVALAQSLDVTSTVDANEIEIGDSVVYTLQAMSVDVFVIRDAEPGVCQYVAEHVQDHVSVVSAGEAHLSHPTQGLLDALTILQFKGGFRDLVVSVVGAALRGAVVAD